MRKAKALTSCDTNPKCDCGKELRCPRIRFNGGFHDGANEALRGRVRGVSDHFDQIYAAAYLAGVETAKEGGYYENSESAWQTYVASK
jgi:hypothetical protein